MSANEKMTIDTKKTLTSLPQSILGVVVRLDDMLHGGAGRIAQLAEWQVDRRYLKRFVRP